jgi:hypothetical protein
MLEPVFQHASKVNIGVLATGGVCVFGKWSGSLTVEGQSLRVHNLIGWAEEFAHRW